MWLAAALASLSTLIAVRELRRWLPAVVIAITVIMVATLALVPGLAVKAAERESTQATIYQREALLRASYAMVVTRPLFGFGWSTFDTASEPYYTVSFGPDPVEQDDPRP